MTNGSSQGLFVIVAVVIFGIFVLISYILFRDNLKTGLASIFEDSISESTNNLNFKKELGNYSNGFDTSSFTFRLSKVIDQGINPITNNVSKTFDVTKETEGLRGESHDFYTVVGTLPELKKIGYVSGKSYLVTEFYIRSDNATKLGVRFGGSLYSENESVLVSKDWKKVSVKLLFTDPTDGSSGANYDGYLLFFGYEGTVFEMSDLSFSYY